MEDAGGARKVELEHVRPGHRYSVGKDGECDVVLDGVALTLPMDLIYEDSGL